MTQYSPYWWQDQPQFANDKDIPVTADVVVVGAGYTGLSAAITLAKSGRSVVVLDAEAIGFGASTRNGGMLGSGHKFSPDQLQKTYGSEVTKNIYKEANASLAYTTSLIRDQKIDCDLQICGRLRTAWTHQDREQMQQSTKQLQKIDPFEAEIVEPKHMDKAIKTNLYFGGLLYKSHASVHPRKFHHGLVQLAIDSGAQIFGNQRVTQVKRLSSNDKKGFIVSIADSLIHCQQVLMATNGYTRPQLSPYLARRIMQVPSFVITTEDIGVEKVQSLLPGGHCMVETRRRFCYYRATPCGRRILLGTRASLHAISPEQALPILRAQLKQIFPSLEGVGISHCWTGFTGFSFSSLPNLGCNQGVYYAMGYSGNGVAMSPYLGHKAALKLLDPDKEHSVFEKTTFDTRYYYHGWPWFLPITSAIYRFYDFMDDWQRKRLLMKPPT